MRYKKYLFLAAFVLILIFPDQIFPVLTGVMILFLILLLVIELALDVYIIAKILIQHYREKKEDR